MINGKAKLLLLIFLVFIASCFGCTGETTNTTTGPAEGYKLYEMKNDDIRLTWCNHPLYSFEYPEMFDLYDLIYVEDLVVSYDRSEVGFTSWQSDMPYRNLWVTIRELWPDHYINANDYLNSWILETSESGGDIKLDEVLVSGINASYLEYLEEPNQKGIQLLWRLVTFDYSGLIWEIKMTSIYTYPESPTVQEAFNHILHTFKIMDASCENALSGNDLNVTVDYEDGVFYITNNEDTRLCELKLFLNYTNDDLSTGYVCNDTFILPEHYTIKIESWNFEDIDGDNFGTWQSPKPIKLLVQAEFPGCNQKVYSYFKTWE